MIRAIDRAAARWSYASAHAPDGQTATGDPDAVGDARRSKPHIPSVEEIQSWGDQPTTDLNQMVTDTGATPAGSVVWSDVPTHLWYPHGSPVGNVPQHLGAPDPCCIAITKAFLSAAEASKTEFGRALVRAAEASKTEFGHASNDAEPGDPVHISFEHDPSAAS